MDEPDFTLAHCRVAIIGLGLMGGSLALALKGHCRELIGVDPSASAQTFAREHNVVDRLTDFESALTVDLIILAAPVRTILAQLNQLAQFVPTNDSHSLTSDRPTLHAPRPTLLDLGSTKAAITTAMRALPDNFDPIGGHPMCGKETGGLPNAEADLFRGKTFVLCPLERTSPQALVLAQEVVNVIGAQPLILDAERHDALAALISHLPYTVASALMLTALSQFDETLWRMAASGFRDTTRLAASDLEMMTDVLITNRAAVLNALAHYKTELDALTTALESGDSAKLRAALQAAQHQRSQLFK